MVTNLAYSSVAPEEEKNTLADLKNFPPDRPRFFANLLKFSGDGQ